MLLKNINRLYFGSVKPLIIHGQTEGSGVHFISKTSPNNIQIQNPLETLIASLAACELGTLRAISRNSKLKIHSVKFITVESAIDFQKFKKGGAQNKIEDVKIQAEAQTNVTQQQLNQWLEKANNSCPVFQMLTLAGVKVDSKWKNIQVLP